MSYDFTDIQLPSEWEQQYDVLSERFYFIDHVNKVTTWVDPRIEIYKKKKQENESKIKSVGSTNTKAHTSSTASNISNNDKKAKEIHNKYPKIALSRIKQLLEDNFGNISSIESILNREVQLAHDQEIICKKEEALKKAETEKQLKEKQEAKLKKEEEKKTKTVKDYSKKTSEKLTIGESNNSQSVRESTILNKNSIDEIRKTDLAVNDVNENSKIALPKKNITKESKLRLDIGPNKTIFSGPNLKNKMGPNQDFIKEKESLAKGPNPSNCVGSKGNCRIKAN